MESGGECQILDTPGGFEKTNRNSKFPDPSKFEHVLLVIQAVRDTGKYNFQQARISVNKQFNIPLLRNLLTDYHDIHVLDLLEYGFPIDRCSDVPLEMGGQNHLGATQYPSHVDRYVQKELDLQATIGPFEAIPFKGMVGISPLSTRAKKDSEQRRIIMDCSWPINTSINDGIDKNRYLGVDIVLKYPTTDDLARQVYKLCTHNPNEQILFYKEDLDRAFRQYVADPGDIPLLGYKWKGGYYFDQVMMMGCRIAPYIAQRVSDCITYIHMLMGYFLLNYVDDFMGVEYASKAYQAHGALVRTLRDVGLHRSAKKSVPPSVIIEFLGNLFNSEKMTIGVTPQRVHELMILLEQWRFKSCTTRRELESLIGKLQFISNCIKSGRLFVSRLLWQLKFMDRRRSYELSEFARQDIRWWYLYLPTFTGETIMWFTDHTECDQELAVDACLSAAGGCFAHQCFTVKFPKYILEMGLTITHFELWAVIIAVKLWGPRLKGKIMLIKTDNEAVSRIVNTGRSYDMYLQKQLRELVWCTAKHEMRIITKHVSGRSNKVPDLVESLVTGAVHS